MNTNKKCRDGIQGVGLFILLVAGLAGSLRAEGALAKRWVYVPSNLYVNENMPRLDGLLERAQKAGYNGVLFADYKMFTWWQLDDAARWKRNAQHLRATTRRLDMELVVCVFPFGYAGSLLWHDVNLASGMPIRQAPLQRAGDELRPAVTAVIQNGSFEEYRDNQALQFAFQDAPGKGSFIDHEVKKDGQVSLRFENIGDANPAGNGRVCQKVQVRPWQQYRIRVWMKTEDLTGDEIKVLVLAGERVLQWQHLQVKSGNEYQYINRVRNLTCDWVEQCVTFNSLDNDSVMIYAGIWGGRKGKLWWDDLRIEAAPVLNVLRRESLPVRVTAEDGTVYEEGVDCARIADPQLGRTPWAGSYETRHESPGIQVADKSRIQEGQTVYLSCYHPVLVYDGQVNCSLNEPKVFELCREQIRYTEEALRPDGYFMSHDEIRCDGWEPEQVRQYKTSGELLAYNVRTCTRIIREAVGNRPVYVWSDMFDPNHNAHADYYLVNNTLAGSWEGLDKDVIVMKWGGGDIAAPGLKFFAERGHRQMIAAYYDSDVASDHAMWNKAMGDIANIDGVMYTTWENNYSDLEAFAGRWWGGTDNQ